MTPEIAVEILKANEERISATTYLRCKDASIEALEKQIAKNPILDTIFPSGFKWWLCPTCRHNDIETNDKFCHNCGQKLDWSKEE